MALKDILVHLDGTPRSKLRLEIAARLAVQCGAHLTGVHVIDIPSANYFYGAAMPFVPANPEEIVERIRAEAMEAAAPLEAAIPAWSRFNSSDSPSASRIVNEALFGMR